MRCGAGIVNLGASGGANCDTLKWYDAQSGGNVVNTGTSYSPNLTQTTTYYVSCKSAAGCESGRTAVTGTINPNPSCSLTAPSTLPNCSSTGNTICVPNDPNLNYNWSVTSRSGLWQITSNGTNCATYTAGSGDTATFKLVVSSKVGGCMDSCMVTFPCQTLFQYCSPGYWKNHTQLWDQASDPISQCVAAAIAGLGAPYSGNGTTSSLFRTTFGLSISQMTAVGLPATLTLQQAINLGGGQFIALARQSVGVLMNSCGLHPTQYTTSQFLVLIHNAIISKNPNVNFNTFENCPLNDATPGAVGKAGSDGTEEAAPMPSAFALHANYPNPFNPTTVIAFDLPEASTVKLTVFNVLGQQVATLVNGTVAAGFQSVVWDADNHNGTAVPSGLYFYRVEARSLTTNQEFVEVRKMLLMK
jgi:hypothetical protein